MSRLPNNGLQLTRSARCAPRATNQGQSLRAALAAEPGCWTGVEATPLVALPSSAPTGIPGPVRAGSQRAALRRQGLGFSVMPPAEVPQPAMIFAMAPVSSGSKFPSRSALSNNALERTRRVGVPASRAVVRVPPCRSTQCWTGRGAAQQSGRQSSL